MIMVNIQNVLTGQIYDITNQMTDFEITLERQAVAGKLSGTFYNTNHIYIPKGSIIMVNVDGVNFFKGYFFDHDVDRWSKTRIVFYDQLKYLMKNKASKYFNPNFYIEDLFEYFKTKFNLKFGERDTVSIDLGYKLFENQTLMDMVTYALQQLLEKTGKIYNFYDYYGFLRLKEAKNMMVSIKLVNGSTILDYRVKGTIDEDTYNVIAYKYTSADVEQEATEYPEGGMPTKNAHFGKLQLFEVRDPKSTKASMEEIAKDLYENHNREKIVLLIEALGDPQVRAGSVVFCDVGTVDGVKTTGYHLIDKITHKFSNKKHTMSLTTYELNNN